MRDLRPVLDALMADAPAPGPTDERAFRFSEDRDHTVVVNFESRPSGEWRVTITDEDPRRPAALAPGTLTWLEQVARAALAGPIAAGAEVFLGRDFATEPLGAAVDELKRAGFALAVAEDKMRRPTDGVVPTPVPGDFQFRGWDASSAPSFFRAYTDAFRDRPGFPNWEQARWTAAFTGSPYFRPRLSTLIVRGPEPAAYSILWIEDGVGWIVQMGVRPPWRGKGLGEALLTRALGAFAADGVETAALEVATNNPHARALYERLGFRVAGTYRSWRKSLTVA